MANYYESARSNYFLVKDVDAFKADLNGSGLGIQGNNDNPNQVALFATEDGFPSEIYDEDSFEGVEIVWEDIFEKHLLDDEVVIIMGAGAEKLRYVNGWAVAYNNKRESKVVSLHDIYDLAKELGSEITRAEY
jgi:hypothetical protein